MHIQEQTCLYSAFQWTRWLAWFSLVTWAQRSSTQECLCCQWRRGISFTFHTLKFPLLSFQEDEYSSNYQTNCCQEIRDINSKLSCFASSYIAFQKSIKSCKWLHSISLIHHQQHLRNHAICRPHKVGFWWMSISVSMTFLERKFTYEMS